MHFEKIDFDALSFAAVSAINLYGHYCIPEEFQDREVSRLLLGSEVNEPGTLRFIRTVAGTGDVISGGAFVGDMLPAISSFLSAGALLHSFEPNPKSFAACEVTLALNSLTNVRLHPVAVAEAPGTLPLLIAGSDGAPLGGMSTLVQKSSGGETVDVKVTTLDAMVDPTRHVSVLHLDVEDFEWAAVQGARRIITENAPVLILEATRPWKQRELERRLQSAFPDLGYSLFAVVERNCFFIAG